MDSEERVETSPETTRLRIGSVELSAGTALAPMAGITNSHFRRLIKGVGGCGIVYTGMVSSEGLVRNCRQTRELLSFAREERPIAVQLFGGRPEAMAEAALAVEQAGADILDINMGCSVKKITKQRAGVALMRDPRRASEIVARLVRSVRIPVTVKIRAGASPAEINAVDFAVQMWHSGASALTVHPRTGADGFERPANWEIISRVKKAVGIPVFGNGDVFSLGDARKLLDETGCDGVMVGRGILRNPWLLNEIRSGGTVRARNIGKLLNDHFHLLLEEVKSRALILHTLRKFAGWYTRGFPGAVEFRRRIQTFKTPEEFLENLQMLVENLEP
jgi:tRNA-dihydrouridine synthase B